MHFVLVGNSHSFLFNSIPNIHFITKFGASIRGLIKNNSSTNLKISVIDSLNQYKDSTYIFYLGQCDIEYGYYYNCVINNSKLNIEIYMDNLINDYNTFLKSIPNNIIIMGINPCVIRDTEFSFNVCFNDTNFERNKDNKNTYNYNDCKCFFNESIQIRNNNHKIFNEKLKKMCVQNNYKYMDLFNIVCDENNNVLSEYYPDTEKDCHLKNNNKIIMYLQNFLNNY
jgi:hypothetical protein